MCNTGQPNGDNNVDSGRYKFKFSFDAFQLHGEVEPGYCKRRDGMFPGYPSADGVRGDGHGGCQLALRHFEFIKGAFQLICVHFALRIIYAALILPAGEYTHRVDFGQGAI